MLRVRIYVALASLPMSYSNGNVIRVLILVAVVIFIEIEKIQTIRHCSPELFDLEIPVDVEMQS